MNHSLHKPVLLVAITMTLTMGLLTAQSEDLLLYDFTGQPGDQESTPATTTNPHITATALSRGAGLFPLAVEHAMASTGWAKSDGLLPEDEDCLEFTITPKKDFSITLSGLSLRLSHSTAGPKNFSVRTSLDNYGSDAAEVYENLETGAQKLTFSFAASASLENLTIPLTIRLYGWNASSRAGGGAHLSSTLAVHGAVSPVRGAKNK